VAAGLAAGAVATVCQSAAVWGPHKLGAYRRRPAPEVVAEAMTEKVVPGIERLAGKPRLPVVVIEHFAFGAAMGAAYAAAAPLIRPGPLSGMATGAAIWKASYDGWIQAAGIMPPVQNDEPARQGSLLAAHLVYGLVLGLVVRRLTPRR
jgi:hypothetical protein